MNSNGNTPAAIDWASMPEWIDIRQASNETGYSPVYLRRVMQKGKIIAEKRGTMWWVDRDSLRAYMALVESLGKKKFSPHGIEKVPAGE